MYADVYIYCVLALFQTLIHCVGDNARCLLWQLFTRGLNSIQYVLARLVGRSSFLSEPCVINITLFF